MQKHIILKAKESKATNSDFYNLFRPIAPTIDVIGKVAQVVSALTEAVTIWFITQSEMSGHSKVVSVLVSIVAMLLVVGVLEFGGRKFLQVLTRAVIWKRLQNAWYIALFVIVSAVTIGMGVISFNLSTNGIRHTFTSAVPTVAEFDNSILKQELKSNVQTLNNRFDKDLVLIKENFGERTDALQAQYESRIAAAQSKSRQYADKYKKGLSWAKGHADKYQKEARQLEAEKTSAVLKLQEQQSKKLDSWQTRRDQSFENAQARYDKAAVKGELALQKVHGSRFENAAFWGSLFSFFVGFSVLLAFICIVSVEVYRRGSGIEVTYEEEEKDPSLFLLFWKGLRTRFDRFFRKRMERFANVSTQVRSASTVNTIGFNTYRDLSTNAIANEISEVNEFSEISEPMSQ